MNIDYSKIPDNFKDWKFLRQGGFKIIEIWDYYVSDRNDDFYFEQLEKLCYRGLHINTSWVETHSIPSESKFDGITFTVLCPDDVEYKQILAKLG